MEKPKWWEVKKRKIYKSQQEVDDFDDISLENEQNFTDDNTDDNNSQTEESSVETKNINIDDDLDDLTDISHDYPGKENINESSNINNEDLLPKNSPEGLNNKKETHSDLSEFDLGEFEKIPSDIKNEKNIPAKIETTVSKKSTLSEDLKIEEFDLGEVTLNNVDVKNSFENGGIVNEKTATTQYDDKPQKNEHNHNFELGDFDDLHSGISNGNYENDIFSETENGTMENKEGENLVNGEDLDLQLDDEDANLDALESTNKKESAHKPTSREVEKMLYDGIKAKPNFSEPTDEDTFAKHKTNLREYIIHHKTKVIIFLSGFVSLILLLYISNIGITTHSLPDFSNDRIKITKADSVNIKYSLGETMSFKNAKMEFLLNDGSAVNIEGDFTISASIFAMISKSITNAHLNIKKATVTVIQGKSQRSIQSIVMQIIDTGTSFDGVFADIKLFDTKVNILNEENVVTDSFTFSDFTFQKVLEKTVAIGIVKINEHKIDISYTDYNTDPSIRVSAVQNNNFNLSVKSHVFEFSIIGMKQSYGTVSKENRINGVMEFVVRNPSQFVSLVSHLKSFPKFLINLPQFSVKGDFEYSSLGNLLNIKNGKVNFLNSLGDFELSTTEAGKKYKATVKFDSFSFEQIANYVRSFNIAMQGLDQTTTRYDGTKYEDGINLFSLVGDGKEFELELFTNHVASNQNIYFSDIKSSISIDNNEVTINSFNMKSGEELEYNMKGKFTNLNKYNPYGIFSFAINGKTNTETQEITQSIVNFFTHLPINKQLEGQQTDITFDVVLKSPSIIFHNILLRVENIISIDGNIQFTQNFPLKGSPVFSEFRDIIFNDVNLKDFSLEVFRFKQGSTLFQEIIQNKSKYSDYLYSFNNSIISGNIIKNAKIGIVAQNGNIQTQINIDSEKYKLYNSTIIDVSGQNPSFNMNTILTNVTDFKELKTNLSEFFQKQYIFIPSFEKFNGYINIIVKDSILFGQTIPMFVMRGIMNDGIVQFPENKFSAIESDVPVISGKIGGKIELSRNIPLFNLQLSFLNIPTKEFQKILPISYEFDGTVSGGGGFVFSGLSYAEFLNSIQTKAKFVLQKTKIPRLNLNFLAQNLLKTHGNKLFELDKQHIEDNLNVNNETEYNVIFSISGGNKKFVIDSCNIKTAYTGGVCAGNISIMQNDNIFVEIVSKFAIPALDINNDLKDIMKLYVSNKTTYDSSKTENEFTTDLVQVYQYINYRRATFGI
jgi:hypothetical protein